MGPRDASSGLLRRSIVFRLRSRKSRRPLLRRRRVGSWLPCFELLERRELLTTLGTECKTHDSLDFFSTECKRVAEDQVPLAEFGASAAISGDFAVVGAPRDSEGGENAGAVYVFAIQSDRPDDFTNWVEMAKLMAEDVSAGDHFGASVAIAGDTIVIGSPLDDDRGVSSGSVYIFERNRGTMTWSEVDKLIPSVGGSGAVFGAAVSVSEDATWIAVGAPFSQPARAGGVMTGSAHIFTRNGGVSNNWIEVQTLTASDGTFGDEFGGSVAVSELGDDPIVVGARFDDDGGRDSGSAYIFSRNSGGQWRQSKKLNTQVGSDSFAASVAVASTTVLVGAPLDDNSTDTGSAYFFTNPHRTRECREGADGRRGHRFADFRDPRGGS